MDAFLDFNAFVSFLETNKYPHNLNRDAQLVELPSKASPPLSGNLLIKWQKAMPFFSLIHFMIDAVPAERIHEVETAITRLNCKLEVPGLGFDHTSNRIFFRLVVPVMAPVGVPSAAFNQLGHLVVRQATDLYPGMRAVVDGRPGESIEVIIGELRKGGAHA